MVCVGLSQLKTLNRSQVLATAATKFFFARRPSHVSRRIRSQFSRSKAQVSQR